MSYHVRFLYIISGSLFFGCGEEYQPEKNTPPQDILVSVETQGNPTTKSIVYCNASAQDSNFNDPLSMNVEWFNISQDVSIGSGTSLTLTPDKVSPNEEISCVATFTDTAGESISGSDSIVIENTPPIIHGLNITPSNIHNDDILRCNLSYEELDNEDVEIVYTWYKSTPIGNDNGQKFDVATEGVQPAQLNLNSEDFQVGDYIYCHVAISDPHETTEKEVIRTIENRLPKPQKVEIEYDGLDNGEPPYIDDTLFCLGVGFDPDGEEPLLLEYSWYIDNVLVENVTESSIYLLNQNVQPEQKVECQVTFIDAQNDTASSRTSVEIGNMPPEITNVSIVPNDVHNYLQSVTCEATVFDMEDAQQNTDVSMSYSWYVNGVEFGTGNTLSIKEADVVLDVGATLECLVDVTDSGGEHVQGNVQVAVSNSNPHIDSVSVIQDGSELKCEPMVQDIDGQDLTFSYSWSFNEESVSAASDQNTLPVSSVILSSESIVTCSVQAFDGIGSSTVEDGSISVVNTPPSIDTLGFVTEDVHASSFIDAVVTITDFEGNASYSFVWYVDGNVQSEDSASLSSVFVEGSVVSYELIVTETFADGSVASLDPVMSSSITVQNAPPTITNLELVDNSDVEAPLTTTSIMTVDFDVNDVDSDDDIACSYVLTSASDELVESTTVLDLEDIDISIDLSSFSLSVGDEITLTLTCENPDESGSTVSQSSSQILE